MPWLGSHSYPSKLVGASNPRRQGVGPSIRLSEPDHHYLRDVVDRIGGFVVGRRLFDLTDGWGGRHPFDKPVVVVTHSVPEDWIAAHPDAPFTFVTDGLASAIEQARAIAGDRNVEVTPGKITSQCLELGLLDEVSIDLYDASTGVQYVASCFHADRSYPT
jgi:dihydrofolate reductase